MRIAIGALLGAIAVIHLLPAVGAMSRGAVERLYGVGAGGADLEILLRHRAVLFGILGGLFGYAAFVPAIQPVAFVAAGVSIVSFLVLARSVGGHGPEVRRVVVVDVVALGCLVGAIVLWAIDRAG